MDLNVAKVFGIPLLVENISSFLNTQKDLLSLRQVNQSFEAGSTKQLRMTHTPIYLNRDSFASFLTCIKKRMVLNFKNFPFSSFHLEINSEMSVESLTEFASLLGQHVRHYELKFSVKLGINLDAEEKDVLNKAVLLLSYSPNLEEITLYSTEMGFPLEASKDDLQRLPEQFHRLKSIKARHRWSKDSYPDEFTPLIHTLIRRAPDLEYIEIPFLGYPDMKLVQVIAETRSDKPLEIEFNPGPNFCLEPNGYATMKYYKELMSHNFKFKKLFLEFMSFPDTTSAEAVQNMNNSVEAWLASQTSTLTSLTLICNQCPGFPDFRIPCLNALTRLTLDICEDNRSTLHFPLAPFVSGQFPVLYRLELSSYRENFKIFGSNTVVTMPTVKHLSFYSPRTPINNPCWLTVFPNLTHFGLTTDGPFKDIARPSIVFILTHLTHLTSLDIQLITVPTQDWAYSNYMSRRRINQAEADFWDILTGQARPSELPGNHSSLSVTGLPKHETRQPAKPSNGLPYEIPSLGNMTALESLNFRPGTLRNLDALLYMYRSSLLGALKWEFLDQIQHQRLDLKEEEELQYDCTSMLQKSVQLKSSSYVTDIEEGESSSTLFTHLCTGCL